MSRLLEGNIEKYVKIFGKLISAFSIVFVIYAIWKLGIDLSFVKKKSTFLGIVLLGVFLKSITVFISAYNWSEWLSFFSTKKIKRREAIVVYGKANIGKYLPGNVMHYVERNIFARNMGISQKKLIISSACEVAILVCSAFLVALFGSKTICFMHFHK